MSADDGSEAWPTPSFNSQETPAAGDADLRGSNENTTSSGAGTFLQPHAPKLSLTTTSSAVSESTAPPLPEQLSDAGAVDAGRPGTTADGVAVFEEDTRSSWNLEPSGSATPAGSTAPKEGEAVVDEREPSASCGAGDGAEEAPSAKSAAASDSSGENRERTPVVSFAPTVVDCDSQNSGSSVKSSGRKRFSDDEVTSEAPTTITADKLFEYHWPQDCGDAYMLQEQVRLDAVSGCL